MSDTGRNWLSDGEIARMEGVSADAIRRSGRYDQFRIPGRNRRYKKCPELLRLIDSWRAVRESVSQMRVALPSNRSDHGPISLREAVKCRIHEVIRAAQQHWNPRSDVSTAAYVATVRNVLQIFREAADELELAHKEGRVANLSPLVRKWTSDPNMWLYRSDTKLPVITREQMLESLEARRDGRDDDGDGQQFREVARRTPERGGSWSDDHWR